MKTLLSKILLILFLGILYPYQSDYAKDNSKFRIDNKSRQIGWSSGCIAYKSLKRCFLDDINQLLCSSSQRQANNLMSYVRNLYEKVYKPYYGIKLTKDTQTQITFNNGKSIFSLPSKPETVRGFAGDVRLDEFALHKDDNKIFEALMPSISSNSKFQLTICSTPLGQSNKFYEIFKNENRFPDFKRTQVDCYEAIQQGCKIDIELIKNNYDEESFRQEFLCEFIDEATAYFTYELIKKAIEDYEVSQIKGRCQIGIDIGRTHDRTSIAVVRFPNTNQYLTSLETIHNKPFSIQKEIISTIIRAEQPSQVLVDKGAIGMQLAEELERDFTCVTGVQLNTNYKNDIVTNAKKLFEKGNFKMNEDRDLITDLHSIKRDVTLQNNISFNSPRDNKGHGDRAWALFLALQNIDDKQKTSSWKTH